MIKLGRVLGIVGFVSLLSVPLTLFLWDWELTWVALAKLLFGVAAISFWLGTNFPKVRETFHGRSVFYGGFSALFVLMALAAVAMVNYVSYQHPVQLDLTEEKIFTLSDQSLKALGDLDKEVEVLAFYGPKESEYAEVQGFLDRYRYASERFSYEMLDPVVRQDLVEKLHIHQGGPRIVVRYGDREERVNLEDPEHSGPEEAITSVLLAVTATGGKKKVCFVTGHGEKSRSGGDPLASITLFERDLKGEGYQAETVSLLEQPRVPEFCQVVVLAGPKKDLTGDELKSLKDYLQGGGRLVVFLGAGDSASPGSLLEGYGIRIGDDTVINPESRSPLYAATDPMLYPASHPVFSAFFQGGMVMLNQLQAVLPMARSVKKALSPPAELELVELVHSGESAWGEVDPLADDIQVAFDQGKDLAGPVPLAVAVQPAGENPDGMRLVVFGSSLLVSDAAYRLFGFNRDLVMNTVAWLTHEEKKISIRPRLRAASQIMMDESQLKFVTFFSSDILPLLILALGITIWQVRRWS